MHGRRKIHHQESRRPPGALRSLATGGTGAGGVRTTRPGDEVGIGLNHLHDCAMKLLTHNLLECHIKGVTNKYPFLVEAQQVEQTEVDFNPGER